MRITTRLRIISTLTLAALAVLAPILIESFTEFKSAKNDYVLAEAIQDNFFEGESFRNQYFLYREDHARTLWDNSNATIDHLLRQANAQFHDAEDRHSLEQLRKHMEDSADIFKRIANNTEALKKAGSNRQVYEELDKRLFSQLLLKGVAFRDTATALKEASARRVEQTYRRLSIIIGLFALTLALVTILTAMHLGKLIRKRLAPLHAGAKIVAGGDLDYRIECAGADEFSELALSINTMTDRLQAFTKLLETEIAERKQAEEMLRSSNQRFEAVLKTVPDLMFELNRSGRYLSVWGVGDDLLAAPKNQLLGHTVDEMLPLAAARETLAAISEADIKGQSFGRQIKLPLPQGDCWFELSVAKTQEASFIALSRDITERKQMEDQLRNERNFINAVLDTAGVLVVVIDREGKIARFNRAAEEFTGYTFDEVKDRPFFWEKFLLPDQRPEVHAVFDGIKVGKVTPYYENYWLSRDGRQRLFAWTNTLLSDNENQMEFVIAVGTDISERQQMEERVRQLAFYDALTKLPNRRLLNDRLNQAMAASKRSGCYGAVIFLDLDNFKPLNDAYGHAVGDSLLIETAARLKSCVREMDTVARFGGDEFVLILSELTVDKGESISQAAAVAEKIRILLAEPYLLTVKHREKADTTVEHHCTASIGVALFINHEASQDDILKWADTAMYQAKEAGRNTVRFYDQNA